MFLTIYSQKFPHPQNSTLKKKLSFILLLFCLSHLSAQEKSPIKLRIEPGVLLKTDSENLGLLLNVEPTIHFLENCVIGLRFGIALNPQKFKIDDHSQFFIDELDDNGVISFVPTFDYYLNENQYRPYIGLGLGYYVFNDTDVSSRNSSSDVLEGSVNNQLGFLVRGGLNTGNIRVGLEYNFIPRATITIPNGQAVGSVNNSYYGLSVGFTIGGGSRSI